MLLLFLFTLRTHASTHTRFEVFEATIPELQAAMSTGRVTSVELVDAYEARIAAYDQKGARLNAMIHLNPSARAEAAGRDTERRAGRIRGPLHGIPVILKDNYGTSDMPTSVGSVAFAGMWTREDAFQVKKLRDAGAVILGKASMDEFAETVEGVSSLGGQTRNPYELDRTPGGSSAGSGAAAAASFAAVTFGTDTGGSMRIPAAFNGLFTLRPTKGLSSMTGIFPCSHTHDTAGPLARTIEDLAISLDATVGQDPADSATQILVGHPLPRFVAALDDNALRGSRIGILTSFFGDERDAEAARIVRSAVDRMTEQGATVIDVALPAEMSTSSKLGNAEVWSFEFKFDLIDFLAHVPDAPVHSFSEILARHLYRAPLEDSLRRYETMGTRDGPDYRAALARQEGIRGAVLRVLDDHHLDAIVYPAVREKPDIIGEHNANPNTLLSVMTGFPALVAPAGRTSDGLPIGMELLGRPLEDARLVALAYAYEQAVKPRQPPFSTPALNGGGALKAMRFKTIARAGGNASVSASFAYDPLTSILAYQLNVHVEKSSQVYAVALTRGTPEQAGPVIHQLAGPGMLAANGVLTLREPERSDFLGSRIYLSVYTAHDPYGSVRAALRIPSKSR